MLSWFLCKWSSFILLNVDARFFQQHLSFPHWVFLAPSYWPYMCQLTIYVWVYFWVLYSVTLIYISVFVPIPYCSDYDAITLKYRMKPGVWYLQLCCSSLWLLWLFRVLCDSMRISGWYVLFLSSSVFWKILKRSSIGINSSLNIW